MRNLKPSDFVLKCYGYKSSDGPYVGVCLNLNIAVQADSVEELKTKMGDAISSYLDVVLDTDDLESIPDLINRKAPLADWAFYYLIRLLLSFKNLRDKFVFKKYIPFHLAHNC